jgi:hypothetical protein
MSVVAELSLILVLDREMSIFVVVFQEILIQVPRFMLAWVAKAARLVRMEFSIVSNCHLILIILTSGAMPQVVVIIFV